jgi:hypothetical protein
MLEHLKLTTKEINMRFYIVRQSIPEIKEYYSRGRFHEEPKTGYKDLYAAKRQMAHMVAAYPGYKNLLTVTTENR